MGFRAVDDPGDISAFNAETIVELRGAPFIEFQPKNPADVT